MLWSLGQFGSRLQMISINGRSFDSFFQLVMEHISTQYGKMTVGQLTSAATGLMICGFPSSEPLS